MYVYASGKQGIVANESKTRRPDEAADYRAMRMYVYGKKISETLKSVE